MGGAATNPVYRSDARTARAFFEAAAAPRMAVFREVRVTRMLLAALLAIASRAGAAGPEVEKAVLSAHDRRIALTIAADVGALGALMTDDLTYTHSSAVVETKGEFLEGLRAGRYRYKAVSFDDRRVRLYGDATAVVSGTCRTQVVAGGRDIDVKLKFTELFVMQQGTWKMALWQSTRVPDPAPAN
jgi:hypothetical protein